MKDKDFSYIFELDYGYRMNEVPFVKDILDRYSNDDLIGANLFVGNNIYYLEFYLHLNFSKIQEDFEAWLNANYPEKIRKFNFFQGDIFKGMGKKSFNSTGLLDAQFVDFLITPEPNGIFMYHDKPTYDALFPPGILNKQNSRVFISHVSEDKDIVIDLYNKLQGKEINAFLDKYGIEYGEDINHAIKCNLNNTKVALVCYSKNYLSKKSEWIEAEFKYFTDNNIKIIPVNIDLELDDMRSSINNKKYFDITEGEDFSALISQIKKDIDGRE